MNRLATRLGIVVFARFDSSRLSGKVLIPIAGRPMLHHVVERLRKVGGEYPLSIATSERVVDDPICRFADELGVAVFRGDAHDVSKRAFDCAGAMELDHIVRISGDSPFIDPQVVTRGIAVHTQEQPDLTTNVDPRSYPFGCSVEVISRSALQRVLAMSSQGDDREHVTRPIYASRDAFRIRNFRSGHDDYAGIRLVVDTPEDLERAQWIAENARPSSVDAPLEEIVHWARTWARTEASRERRPEASVKS